MTKPLDENQPAIEHHNPDTISPLPTPITDIQLPKDAAKFDKAALQVLKLNPTLNNHQLGCILHEQGAASDVRYIYKRLTKSQNLRESLAHVRQNQKEYISRTVIPAADTLVHHTIKNKEAKLSTRLRAAEAAYKRDAELQGLTQDTKVGINIAEIRVLISGNVGD